MIGNFISTFSERIFANQGMSTPILNEPDFYLVFQKSLCVSVMLTMFQPQASRDLIFTDPSALGRLPPLPLGIIGNPTRQQRVSFHFRLTEFEDKF